MRRWLLAGGGALLLGLGVVAGVLLARPSNPAASGPAATPDRRDRVVGVTIACAYTFSESLGGGDFRQVTREGTGEFCTPPEPHVVGATRVRLVDNVRAVVTVRTPAGGSYTVEHPNLETKVGDPWPPTR